MADQAVSQVTIPNTERHFLQTKQVDQGYTLLIAKPDTYDQTDIRYPVLFILDADAIFGMVTEMVRIMQLDQDIPQMLIVGIGYPTTVFGEIMALRQRDDTPTVQPEEEKWLSTTFGIELQENRRYSGGAAQFLRFITQELIPFLDGRLRIDLKDLAIAGWSYGGLFSLYALFQADSPFKRYMILSPSIAWDDRVILKEERRYAGEHTDLPVKLFLAAGGNESERMVANLDELEQILRGRAYAGLDMSVVFFDNETHLSVLPGALSRGIRAIYGAT
ncbi:MAG: alpha/beta hydrolase [Candidatus Promineifilaceae bacterium]|jgi:predicted alpha/beta superfamily hydrolase